MSEVLFRGRRELDCTKRTNERTMPVLSPQINTRRTASAREEDRKSKRRRLLRRITRFASSPTVERVQVPVRGSVSCVDLLNIADSDSGSELELFVDCADPPKPVATATWGDLPAEVKVNVLSFCGPTQRVRLSAVSIETAEGCGVRAD